MAADAALLAETLCIEEDRDLCIGPVEGLGGMDEPEIKIIDVFVCKLRKKLAVASGGKDYIETVWGRGYLLREPQEVKVKMSA